MKSTKNKNQTKFIASINEKHTDATIDELADILYKDGVKVDHVSGMLGYISGKANLSLKELQNKYEKKGLNFESNREINI